MQLERACVRSYLFFGTRKPYAHCRRNSYNTPSCFSILVFCRPRDTLFLHHPQDGSRHCLHIRRHLCRGMHRADHPSIHQSQLPISYPDVKRMVVYVTPFPLLSLLLLSSALQATSWSASAA